MASPEVVETTGAVVPGFHEEHFALEGWKKKWMLKKGGTPKKKDVIFVAPDGEEIRNKRQLEKYLKNHPGGPSVADFDWSTGETPRRSARLSSKGRLSSDSADAEPASKRAKSDEGEEDPVIVVSPRNTSRRKSRPDVVSTGTDEILEPTEKITEGDSISGDVLTADSDAKLTDGTVLPRANETLLNNTDGEHGGEGIPATVDEANVGELAEQVPPPEEVISVRNSAHEVKAEGEASKTDEPVSFTDVIMEGVTAVEAATVVAGPEVGDVVPLEQPAATSIEAPAVEDVVQPVEKDAALKEEVIHDVLIVPTTERLDGMDDDHLKPKELIESQGIHALVEEPVFSGEINASEQQTEHPLPSAERVGVST